MAEEEYNWLDDAFDESKPDPLERKSDASGDDDYDWIDDAFDEGKEDPLAKKGMTGCSRLAVVLALIGVVAVLALTFFIVLNPIASVVAGA